MINGRRTEERRRTYQATSLTANVYIMVSVFETREGIM